MPGDGASWNQKTRLKTRGIRTWMRLLILDAVLAGCTEQTSGWQCSIRTKRGAPFQEVFLQTIRVPGRIHPIYRLSSRGLAELPVFKWPWKGSAKLSFCTAKPVLTPSPNQAFTVKWKKFPHAALGSETSSQKYQVTNCATNTARDTFTACSPLTHLLNSYAPGWMWLGQDTAHFTFQECHEVLLWEVPKKHTYCHYK